MLKAWQATDKNPTAEGVHKRRGKRAGFQRHIKNHIRQTLIKPLKQGEEIKAKCLRNFQKNR